MMTGQSTTPRDLGYRWPAEWEPHAATWLGWPHNRDTWPGRSAEAIAEFVEFAKTLARCEPLHVLAGSGQVMRAAETFLGNREGITLRDIPTNDAWIRDFGPIFLKKDEQTAIVDWRYNAWGHKYPPFDDDAASTERIGRQLRLPRFSPPCVLEGGSVEGNGEGVLMTTRSCLLQRNRNPNFTAEAIEEFLREFFASEQVIWLDGEIAGDDTDGHIDQLARFLSPHVVAVASEANQDDVNFAPLVQLRRHLDNVRVAGRDLEIVEIPLPTPILQRDQRLPASYLNFYIANELVIVPQFWDVNDRRACDILREHFPNRDVLGLSCRELVLGLGGFHCLTQQQPA